MRLLSRRKLIRRESATGFNISLFISAENGRTLTAKIVLAERLTMATRLCQPSCLIFSIVRFAGKKNSPKLLDNIFLIGKMSIQIKRDSLKIVKDHR
jgi:hypothetical protein